MAAVASFWVRKGGGFVYSPHRRSPSTTVVGRRGTNLGEEEFEGGGCMGLERGLRARGLGRQRESQVNNEGGLGF